MQRRQFISTSILSLVLFSGCQTDSREPEENGRSNQTETSRAVEETDIPTSSARPTEQDTQTQLSVSKLEKNFTTMNESQRVRFDSLNESQKEIFVAAVNRSSVDYSVNFPFREDQGAIYIQYNNSTYRAYRIQS